MLDRVDPNALPNRAVALGCLLLLGCLAGCGDSASEDSPPDDETPPASSLAESAIMAVTRGLTPDGRFILVNVVPHLEERDLVFEEAFPANGFSRARTFNGKLFVFDGESGEIARFDVGDDGSFTEEARLSMANLGVRRFISSTVFISPTRAQYIDTTGNQVILFNPETMELTASYALPELDRGDQLNKRVNPPERIGDELFSNVRWFNPETLEFDPNVTVFVFSATENRLLRVVDDSRCAIAGAGFVDQGQFYAVGEYEEGTFNVFGIPENPPPPCVLRIGPGDASFDPGFALDLRETVGAPQFAGGLRARDGAFAIQSYQSDIDPSSFPTAQEYNAANVWRWTLVDYETEEATVLQGLPLGETTPFGPFLVDEQLYVPVFDATDGSSVLYRVNEDGSIVPSLRSQGQIIGLERLR